MQRYAGTCQVISQPSFGYFIQSELLQQDVPEL